MTPYLVLAQARSGSAWLSNFLTSGDCICIHEPCVSGVHPEGYRVVGGVDTGAALMLATIRERMPGVRLYALTRDNARDSCERLGLPWIEWASLEVPTFRYEQLFDVDYLRDVWTELNGPGFDPVRAAQLIELNVQHDLHPLVRRAQGKMQWLG